MGGEGLGEGGARNFQASATWTVIGVCKTKPPRPTLTLPSPPVGERVLFRALLPLLFRRALTDRIDTHAVMLGNSRRRIARQIIPPRLRPQLRTVVQTFGDGAFGFWF